MADESVREYLENNSAILDEIRDTLLQSNTRLESVVDILTIQSDTLAEQMRVDALARENEELRLTEQQREQTRESEASGRMERMPAAPETTGTLDTPTRGGLLLNLIRAGLLAALSTAAYRYFGLDEFKDELLSDEAYDEFRKSVGEKFDSLIFGEQTESGERVGGLMGAIEANPIVSAAAGAGLVSFLMNGARFRALPGAMATFMLGYIGLNAFFNPEANEEVAASIDDGIKYLEDNFGTELFNILRDDYGIDIDGEGVVNVLQAAAIYKGTSLAMRLFGARGRGKFLIPLAGAMAAFAFNYFGLDEFFEPDDEDELFDFLESETLSEYGDLIAAALGMGAVAFGPGMATALAIGAADKGRSRAPKGSNSLRNRMFGRLPGGGRGALIAFAASVIAAYTYNRLGLDELFAGDDEQIDSDLDEATQDELGLLIDSAAVGAAAGLAVGAANTPYARRGYVYDRNTGRYRVAPGSSAGQRAGSFASKEAAERTALQAFPKLQKLFRAIPGLSAAFAAGDAYFILNDDRLTLEEKIAMLSGTFAGLGLSVILAGAGALLGPIGAGVGGLVGYLAGDYVVRNLLLWALSGENENTGLDNIRNEAIRVQAEQARYNNLAAQERAQMGDGITPGTAIGPGGVTVSTDPGSMFNEYRGQSGVTMAEREIEEMIQESGVTNYSLSPEEVGRINRESTYTPPAPAPQQPQVDPQSSVVPETTPGAEVTEDSARTAAESYLGRAMSDDEWNYLTRATYAESAGQTGGEYTTEKGMVMATILNRARTGYQDHPRGSVIGALVARNQFQAVTGTPGDRNPSPMFVQGPTARSYADILNAAVNILPTVSREQTRFTAAATAAYGPGTNIGYRDTMLEQGGVTVGGTVFNTTPSAVEEVSSLQIPPTIASLNSNIQRPTVTPSAMSLGAMSGNVNVPVTTVVNNIDNSQNIASAGKGSGAARTAAARNVRRDTSYMSSAMTQFA